MGEPLIGFLQKFTDNAHAGKIITDLGSGFILGLGFAFWTGAVFDVTVLPYHRRLEFESEKVVLDAKVDLQTRTILELLGQCPPRLREASLVTKDDVDPDVPVSVVSEYIKARVEIVHSKVLAALEAEKAKDYGASCAAADASKKEPCELLDDEISKTRLFPPRLSTRMALLDAYQTRRAATAAELQKSRDLWKNIEYLFAQLDTLVFIGGLLGVLFSQVSRQLIIRTYYHWRLTRPGSNVKADATDRIVEAIAEGKVKREQHDLLVSDYFRYAEASANMVIPLAIFGSGFIAYMVHIQSPAQWFLGLVGLVTFLCVPILLESGFRSNESYLRKVESLLAGANKAPAPCNPPAA